LAKTAVLGVFTDRQAAEKAVSALKAQGFGDAEVSVVGKKDGGPAEQGRGGVGEGAAWGTGVGGALGLLAAAGAVTVPGIGPLLAMGPLATALGGAAAGGLAGTLLDWGIPTERGRQIEEKVKQGRYIALVDADGKADRAVDILRNQGAQEVEKFTR